MPTETSVTLYEGNDEQLDLRVTDSTGSAVDITNVQDIEVYLKENTSENNSAAVLMSKVNGDITIVNGPQGKAQAQADRTTVVPSKTFIRGDVIDSNGRHKTFAYGELIVVNL